MDNQVLQYMAMGYNIHPNGDVQDPYSGAIVDTLDLSGVSISFLQQEIKEYAS